MPTIEVIPIAIKNTAKIDNSGKFLKKIGVKVSFTMLAGRKINPENLEVELEQIRQEIITCIED
jgi:hypothetical protein